VVEDTHPHHLAGLAQAAGDLDVLLRRSRITGWVVVTKDHTCGAVPDDLVEAISWMNDARGE